MLVDGHHIVRAALRSLLTALGGIIVVGDTGDGREALDLVAKLQPQLVLLEIVLPGLGGVEATRRIVREFPAVRPLHTVHDRRRGICACGVVPSALGARAQL
jgi:two-component system, NarL family, invasion response regulator UvrY